MEFAYSLPNHLRWFALLAGYCGNRMSVSIFSWSARGYLWHTVTDHCCLLGAQASRWLFHVASHHQSTEFSTPRLQASSSSPSHFRSISRTGASICVSWATAMRRAERTASLFLRLPTKKPALWRVMEFRYVVLLAEKNWLHPRPQKFWKYIFQVLYNNCSTKTILRCVMVYWNNFFFRHWLW